MNCPSRVDETLGHNGWNQNPPSMAADMTTRQDMNGIVNSRLRHDNNLENGLEEKLAWTSATGPDDGRRVHGKVVGEGTGLVRPAEKRTDAQGDASATHDRAVGSDEASAPGATVNSEPGSHGGSGGKAVFWRTAQALAKFAKFIGPGFLVAVAYIDPGNYSTDVAAGATFRFRLLFIILMSNLFAIFLQSLCIKLGTVTGLNLAEHCRAHLPMWLNIVLYIFAESAIIATDIAEVIGSAIALNLLLHIPLVAGCAITLVDVLVILLFYNPSGSMRRLRAFELFVVAFVLAVVICFCIQLSLIQDTTVGEVLRGYIPSSTIVESEGDAYLSLYLSCGILGATVMPHSLYLGSGIVQSRLRHFDIQAGESSRASIDDEDLPKYRPSLAAIRFCLNYSIAELTLCLFTFALFVNSSILITAGAALSNKPDAQDADLFGIYDLLSQSIAPAAGTIFALALLFSGTSAGIVCTIAGQMVSEGALNWTVAPWLRRLLTRAISITPAIIIAGAVGKEGLSAALNGTQVALSVILPFVSAPLIYFTCRNRYMTVTTIAGDGTEETVNMRNHWITATLAVLIWLVIVIMNVALLVLVGLGKA
ncbi:MAG: hypothetical protein M1825_006235 [Sarcosagium campestre]|nr:MAG: hypothetical protein M1825_006235 [Sarcosagium campestre]